MFVFYFVFVNIHFHSINTLCIHMFALIVELPYLTVTLTAAAGASL